MLLHECRSDNRVQCQYLGHDELHTKSHVSEPSIEPHYLLQVQVVATGIVDEWRSMVCIDRVLPPLGESIHADEVEARADAQSEADASLGVLRDPTRPFTTQWRALSVEMTPV